eukprot:3230638-Prymnesium_polylepis.4
MVHGRAIYSARCRTHTHGPQYPMLACADAATAPYSRTHKDSANQQMSAAQPFSIQSLRDSSLCLTGIATICAAEDAVRCHSHP